MNPTAVYRKTTQGNTELKERAGKLERKFRSLLILMDGVRPVSKVLELTAAMNFTAADIEKLEQQHYIEPAAAAPEEAPAAGSAATTAAAAGDADELTIRSRRSSYDRYAEGQAYLNEIAKETLGLRALFFVLKVEKCSNADDVIALLDDFEQAVTKSRGGDYARTARATAEAILQE